MIMWRGHAPCAAAVPTVRGQEGQEHIVSEPAGPNPRTRALACAGHGPRVRSSAARRCSAEIPAGAGRRIGGTFPGGFFPGREIADPRAGGVRRARKANGVPGAGRRRQYVRPGYQACTSIRLSGTSPARRASRGWSRVGTRQPYSDSRSVTPFYVGWPRMGTPWTKTFTGARPSAGRNPAKILIASRRNPQGSGSIRGTSIHWGDFASGFFASLLPCSGQVLKAFF